MLFSIDIQLIRLWRTPRISRMSHIFQMVGNLIMNSPAVRKTRKISLPAIELTKHIVTKRIYRSKIKTRSQLCQPFSSFKFGNEKSCVIIQNKIRNRRNYTCSWYIEIFFPQIAYPKLSFQSSKMCVFPNRFHKMRIKFGILRRNCSSV